MSTTEAIATRAPRLPKLLALLILSLHVACWAAMSLAGVSGPLRVFNLLLLAANVVLAKLIADERVNLLVGAGTMGIIIAHAVFGDYLAADAWVYSVSLTKGAFLFVNILAFYVGVRIFDTLSGMHGLVFLGSYALLVIIFIRALENARGVFLLAAMGLCATARNLKLLSFFWAIVVSFTFCQPYAWQMTLILVCFLKVAFSINTRTASTTTMVFLLVGLIFVLFVLFPVVVLLLQEDPRNIVNMLKDSHIRQAIYLTAVTATISTSILVVFTVPLAYAMSRVRFFGKPLLLSLIDIPIVIPQSAAGIALLHVFAKNQYVGEVLFEAFGIRFDGTVLGICLAQIFVAMPFITKTALAAFSGVPASLEHNAKVLGASSFSAFRRVAVPLASRGLLIGAILAWARAAGEFGAVIFIASYPVTAPVAVYNRFVRVGLVEVGPLVTTLLLFSLLMFFLLQYSSRFLTSAGIGEE